MCVCGWWADIIQMSFKLNPGLGESLCRLICMDPCEERADISGPASKFCDGGSNKKCVIIGDQG